jgi:hypothetical protein
MQHHQCTQWHAFIFCQQKCTHLGCQEIKRGFKIALAVNRKAITHSRFHHHVIENGQFIAPQFAHGHAFALGQTHIIAPLALHARQHRILIATNVQHNGAGWLDGMQTAS